MAITTVDLGSVIGPQGPQGVQGIQGVQGAKGAAGAAGTKGADGTVWIMGTAAPTTQGKTGDLFLNTTNHDVYSKASGSWVKTGNIKGATGATGPQGPKGDTGAQGPKGDTGTTPSIGSNGHWYVGDRDTGIMGDASKAIEPKIINSLATTTAGYALDARQGKTLDGKIAKNTSDITALNADLEVSRTTAEKTGNITANATVTKSGNIKLLKINTTTTLAMSPGTDYSLCTLTSAQLPDTDVIKYIRHGKITIAKNGRVTINPEFTLTSGQYLHIVECYI